MELIDFVFILGDVCSTMSISFSKGALSAQRSLQGTYSLSSKVNGVDSWISRTKAIWAYPQKNVWLIGRKAIKGGKVAGIYARRKSGTGVDSRELTWNYQNNKAWKRAKANEINIICLD